MPRFLAQVIGVSLEKAARRYRRLRNVAWLRVAAPPAGWTDWSERLRCAPGAAAGLAAALAGRADASGVVLASGGTEVICSP